MKKLLLIFLAFTLLCSYKIHALKMDFEQYFHHSGIQWCWAITSLQEVSIPQDASVLDIGFGDGKISAYLSKQVSEGIVIGIDPDPDALLFAAKKFSSKEYPNLLLHNYGIENLPYSQTFDIATSFCSLNWIEDKELFFQKAMEALKPGGKLLVVIPAPESRPKNVPSFFINEKWVPYLQVFKRPKALPVEDYQFLAESFGFETLFARTVNTSYPMQNFDELKKWAFAVNRDLQTMPQDLQEEYFQYIFSILQQQCPQAGDGRIYLFGPKIELLFQKPQDR